MKPHEKLFRSSRNTLKVIAGHWPNFFVIVSMLTTMIVTILYALEDCMH